jgi:UDP-N-acetylglucosamine--N-acetylmuramyl-(pentapeptide) pyrophosphoryl-undecaprenol N-acetylglucosamine transferase
VHEANARAGLANRVGARFAAAVAETVPDSLPRAQLIGIPLRKSIESLDRKVLRSQAREHFGINDSAVCILVFGGSQGSQAINSVIESTRKLIKDQPITIVHSVGAGNVLPASDDAYISFSYIENMATAYLASDVVIARSGAITCSEVNALGKYALFIPLPIGNGEQSVNADHLVEMGRARVLEQSSFTASWLLDNMDSMLATSDQLSDLPHFGDLEAAAKIVALAEHQLSAGEK